MKSSLQDKKYKVINVETAKLGRFEIELDTVEDGGEHFYSFIRQKSSVGVLPFHNGKIILVNQYRHAHERYMMEIPGGGIENNEDQEKAAIRELSEEVGYACKELHYLGKYCPSPGSSNEVTYLYLAECTDSVQISREPLEYMEIMEVTPDEMNKMVLSGEIEHSMSIIAWMYYMQGREKC